MPRPALAFALAGLGGFNAHGAGFLQAARDSGVQPDLITATSGQIAVLAAYLSGQADLRAGLIDTSLEDDPFAQLRIALFGIPGVFEPALGAAIARLAAPPYVGRGIDFYADRFLPAQLYRPTRTPEAFDAWAAIFNASRTGVLFNAYDPATGDGVLYGNDAARGQIEIAPALPVVPEQRSADTRAAGPAAIRPITRQAIEAALWLSFYGFSGLPGGEMDGAYHRSCLVAELHTFDTVVVCRPLAQGWRRDRLPKSWFDVQDWNTEMWFSAGYRAEVDAMKRINSLVARGAISDPSYRFVHLHEVEPETPAGYFHYFVERDAVFDEARAMANALFRRLAERLVQPAP